MPTRVAALFLLLAALLQQAPAGYAAGPERVALEEACADKERQAPRFVQALPVFRQDKPWPPRPAAPPTALRDGFLRTQFQRPPPSVLA